MATTTQTLPKIDAGVVWSNAHWRPPPIHPSRPKGGIYTAKDVKRMQYLVHPFPHLVFENGMTRGSVTVDPAGLLGDSRYIPTLNEQAREVYASATQSSLPALDGGRMPDKASCISYIDDHMQVTY